MEILILVRQVLEGGNNLRLLGDQLGPSGTQFVRRVFQRA